MKSNKCALVVSAASLMAALFMGSPASTQTVNSNLRVPLKVEDFARWEQFSSVSMTPDGKSIIALYSNSGREQPAIGVWNADNLQQAPFLFGGGSRTSKFIFASAIKNDRMFLIFEDLYDGPFGIERGPGRDLARKVYVTDLRGSFFQEPGRRQGVARTEFQDILRSALSSANILGTLPNDPDHILISRVESDVGEILKLNIRNGTTERILRIPDGETIFTNQATQKPFGSQKLDTDAKGTKVVFRSLTATGQWVDQPRLSYYVKERKLVNVEGQTEDGKWYVTTNDGSDLAQARVYDPQTGDYEPEVLFSHPKYEIAGNIFGSQASDFGKLTGFVIGGPTNEQFFVDPTLKSIHDGLKAAFSNKSVSIVDYTDDKNRVLFSVESSTSPPAFYILDNRRQVRQIGSTLPTVQPQNLRPTEFYSYKARDGLDIPAFLTLPTGWTPAEGKIPLVVIPHGGPWARDYADFDRTGWTQLLASRGYAVMQPQYRGSEGFGEKLWKAGDEQWGLKMQDDKDDGVKELIARGIVDPNRVAMFGYSYGGYAAFAASIRPNGLYRCAIAGAPVSDLGRIQSLFGSSRLQRQIQGWTVKGLDPITRVADVQIPMLIYHGDRDGRVPLFHGKEFFQRAKALGKDVEYLEVRDMPHSNPWTPAQHGETLRAIDRYLASPKCFGNGK